jgi:hypothetical protein
MKNTKYEALKIQCQTHKNCPAAAMQAPKGRGAIAPTHKTNSNTKPDILIINKTEH